MTKPLVSVIMTVYNAEHYLDNSITSILSQTYSNFEFIIIDDCSTDNSYQILQKYAALDKRIKLFRNTVNKKQAFSANIGIENSAGKYIVRMDADDISLPDRIMQQVNFMEQNQDVVVCGARCSVIRDDVDSIGVVNNSSGEHGFCGVRETGKILEFASDPDVVSIKMYLFCCELAQPAVIMSSKIFKQYKLKYRENNDNYAEDWQLWIDILDNGMKISNLDSILLHYRDSPLQVTKQNSVNIAISRKDILSYGLSKLFRNELTDTIVDTHLNLLLAPKGIGFIFKLGAYYKHLKMLKTANKKNRIFDVSKFDEFINQYYLRNKLLKKLSCRRH